VAALLSYASRPVPSERSKYIRFRTLCSTCSEHVKQELIFRNSNIMLN
jgi:hypothetical protein